MGAAVHLLRRYIGFLGGLTLSLFLLAGEGMANWSVAAMCELPAMSWSVAAAAMAALPPGSRVRWRLATAGVLLAAASHVKLTALLVLPALLVMVWAQGGWRRYAPALVWGAFGFAGTFGLLVLLSPSFDVEQLLASHVRATAALNTSERLGFRPHWEWFAGDPAPIAAALFAFAHPAVKQRRPPMLFALTLLVTVIGIAVLYRPWWRYYLIHLQVPLAMLGAVGVTWLSRQVKAGLLERPSANSLPFGDCSSHPTARFHTPVAVMGSAAVLALWCSFALPRLVSNLAEMDAYPTAQASPLVQAIRLYRERIRWCYTELRDVAFHAGVACPPELIVVSRKRFWSESLDERRLLNFVRLYAPEAILVSETFRERQPVWETWLRQDYVLCAKEHGNECWLARSLNPVPLPGVETRLERFNL